MTIPAGHCIQRGLLHCLLVSYLDVILLFVELFPIKVSKEIVCFYAAITCYLINIILMPLVCNMIMIYQLVISQEGEFNYLVYR